jgi:hypothetical protein
MITTLTSLAAAAVLALQTTAATDRAAIQNAITQRDGVQAHVTSVIVSGNYAVARAEGGVHAGLRFSGGRWQVVCHLGAGTASAAVLRRSCGFSAIAAMETAGNEAVNAAASQGEFAAAASSQQAVFQIATPGMRASEAARLQLLRTLNQQTATGAITRADALRRWNELRFAFFLPY